MAIKKRKLIQRAITLERVSKLTADQRRALKELWIESAQELVGIAETDGGREGLLAVLQVGDEQLDEIVAAAKDKLPKTSSPRLLMAARAAEESAYSAGSVKPPLTEMELSRASAPYVTVAFAAELPTSVDYRKQLPAVRSQGDRGTCVACASVCVREHLEIMAGAALDEIDLSEQFVYWYCKENDGLPTMEGTFTHLGLECMQEIGVPEERYWPYNPFNIAGDESQGPPPEEALEKAGIYRITRLIRLNPERVKDLKTCLADGKVVCFSIPVFDSWYYSAAVKRYGKITMPLPGEEANGGHAMTMVGYMDDKGAPGGGYFLIRNSWSPWGYQSTYGTGYGTIPYAYIANHCYAAYSADRHTESDIHIRDSAADDGEVPGENWYWNSPDIWVRNKPDGIPLHQNPIKGQDNYLYLRVLNRGQAIAYNVSAHVYTCDLSPCIWPRNWKLLRTVEIPAVRPGVMVIGPLRWEHEESLLRSYLVRLESADDPIQHDWSVQWDNNIAQKSLAVLDLAPGEEGSLRFIMHGLWGRVSRLTLDVDRVTLPAETDVGLETATRRLPPDLDSDAFELELGKSRSTVLVKKPVASLPDLELRSSEDGKVTLQVKLADTSRPGEQHDVVLTQRLGPLIVGRLVCRINVREP